MMDRATCSPNIEIESTPIWQGKPDKVPYCGQQPLSVLPPMIPIGKYGRSDAIALRGLNAGTQGGGQRLLPGVWLATRRCGGSKRSHAGDRASSMRTLQDLRHVQRKLDRHHPS